MANSPETAALLPCMLASPSAVSSAKLEPAHPTALTAVSVCSHQSDSAACRHIFRCQQCKNMTQEVQLRTDGAGMSLARQHAQSCLVARQQTTSHHLSELYPLSMVIDVYVYCSSFGT